MGESQNDKDQTQVSVRFWGVRAGFALPGPDTVRYGGNTQSIEIRVGDRVLIVDGGTGLRPLGDFLAASGTQKFDMLLTHAYLDRICGIPFFGPVFIPTVDAHIWCRHTKALSPRDVMDRKMRTPWFPITPDIFGPHVTYHDFEGGDVLDLGDGLTVQSRDEGDVSPSTFYRIEAAGRVIVILPDMVAGTTVPDDVIAFAKDADMLIYGGWTAGAGPKPMAAIPRNYAVTSPDDPCFDAKAGLALAEKVGARQLALYQHPFTLVDDHLDQIEEFLAAAALPAHVAIEQLEIGLN